MPYACSQARFTIYANSSPGVIWRVFQPLLFAVPNTPTPRNNPPLVITLKDASSLFVSVHHHLHYSRSLPRWSIHYSFISTRRWTFQGRRILSSRVLHYRKYDCTLPYWVKKHSIMHKQSLSFTPLPVLSAQPLEHLPCPDLASRRRSS